MGSNRRHKRLNWFKSKLYHGNIVCCPKRYQPCRNGKSWEILVYYIYLFFFLWNLFIIVKHILQYFLKRINVLFVSTHSVVDRRRLPIDVCISFFFFPHQRSQCQYPCVPIIFFFCLYFFCRRTRVQRNINIRSVLVYR